MSVPLAYLGIIVLWSTTPLAIKWSGEGVGFLFGISARMIIAALICLAVFAVFRWPLPRDKKALHVYIAIGLPLYCAFMSAYFGAQYIPSGLISVVFGLTPIFTGLFAAALLKERIFTFTKVTGMLLGVLGLAVIFKNSMSLGDKGLLGVIMLLMASVFQSFGTVWVKRVMVQLHPFTANTGGVTVAAILYSVTLGLSGKNALPQHIPLHTEYAIVYLAVFGSILGAVLFFYALRHVSATSMGMLTLITPVSALMIGKTFNHESIDLTTLLGTGLIMLGLIVYQWSNLLKHPLLARPIRS